MAPLRDHGGNLEVAKARWGGETWIDLSTGINRAPWPIPPLPAEAYTALPTVSAQQALLAAARLAYETAAPIVALAGAQAAIQLVPHLRPPGRARLVTPTYNEHAAALTALGWQVEPVEDLAALAGADLAVVVNPNNPDGRLWPRSRLMGLVGRVGLLVVDESFADPDPRESLADMAGQGGLLVLKSFGKFYGLAGLRLGFVLGAPPTWRGLRHSRVPGRSPARPSRWARWRSPTALGHRRARTAVAAAPPVSTVPLPPEAWRLVGGTALFRTYATGDAEAAQDALARQGSGPDLPLFDSWLSLGLPGDEAEWRRLEAALRVRANPDGR